VAYPDPGTVYADDPTIPDDAVLYRMLRTGNVKWAGSAPQRVGTNAFQDQREDTLAALGVPATAVSISLESELVEAELSIEDVVRKWGPEYGAAAIEAGAARAVGQGVTRWPTDDHPAHGMIFVLVGPKKTNSQSKQLAKAARLVVVPPPPQTT
jgi:hypothetical protein